MIEEEDENCEVQALAKTDTCVRFGCENAQLQQDKGTGFWLCPNCNYSYGADAK